MSAFCPTCGQAASTTTTERHNDCTDPDCVRAYVAHQHRTDGSLWQQVEMPPTPGKRLPTIEEVAGSMDLTGGRTLQEHMDWLRGRDVPVVTTERLEKVRVEVETAWNAMREGATDLQGANNRAARAQDAVGRALALLAEPGA